MRFSLAIFLFTVGAILKFAIKADGDPVDINAIGVIFMIMGVVTLVLQYLPARQVDPEVVPHLERPGDGPEVIVREVPVREARTRRDRDVID
ncbi:hypothetical protein [Actinocorallia populi]|uniref:hypothetical protein n=1 Tax=Actinocorallia populi TaxID=2079200 RepID=UPI000D08B072|nr:hypothetical protein [Actinocorallia populi]